MSAARLACAAAVLLTAAGAGALDLSKVVAPKVIQPTRLPPLQTLHRPSPLSAADKNALIQHYARQFHLASAVVQPSAFDLSVAKPVSGAANVVFLSARFVGAVSDTAELAPGGFARLYFPARKGFLYLVDCAVSAQQGIEVGVEMQQQGGPATGGHAPPQDGHASGSFLATSDRPATVLIGPVAGRPQPDPAPAQAGAPLQFFGCQVTPVAATTAGR